MTVHICKLCYRQFKNHTHLLNHYNKKKSCTLSTNFNQLNHLSTNFDTNFNQENTNFTNQDTNFNQKSTNSTNLDNNIKEHIINSESLNDYLNDNKCVYCNLQFTCKASVIRHFKGRCKEKNKIEKQKEEIFDKLKLLENENKSVKEQNIELKEIIKDMGEKFSYLIKNIQDINPSTIDNNIQNNILNNIHNGNNIQQNFTLISYGKEDISQFDQKALLNSINKVYSAPLYLTDEIHFNEKFPEYHNIYIPSMKEKYAMKYFDGRWNLVDRDNLIDQIYEDKKTLVDENLNKFVNNLTRSKRERLEEWIESENNDKGEGTVKIKEELKLLLYNKRYMAMNRIDENKKKCKI